MPKPALTPSESPLLANEPQPAVQPVSKTGGRTQQPAAPKPVVLYTTAALVAVVVAAGSFFAGMQFQKQQTAATADVNGPGPRGQFGGRGFAQNGTMGEVTAISASSITVSNDRTGSSATYAITSATTINNTGATATAADIAVGDQVFVAASSNDSKTAARIMVGGGMGGPSDGPAPDADSQLN